MNPKISPTTMSGLSSTLLIPLWAKAVEHERPDALLKDDEAVRMMQAIDYDFDRFTSARLSQTGCCGRAALIDDETRRFIRLHPDAVVIQLGAGLDARFERLGRPGVTAWYDLDLPEVMAVRERLLPASTNHYLTGSLLDEHWTDTVASHGKPVLLVLEGVLMYFDESEVRRFFDLVARKLPQATIVFDALPPKGVGKSRHHDALKSMENEQRPEFKWGPPDLHIIERWQPGLKVAAVHQLSDTCGKRYPFWLRLILRTGWGRRNADQRIVRVEPS